VVADFESDLAFGKRAEVEMLAWLPSGWALSDDRRWDLQHADGRTLELKVERRPWTETVNVFFEHQVNGKPGGPWRAAEDGVDLYTHLFHSPVPMALVWTNVPALVRWCDAYLKTTRVWGHHIKNKGWTGVGFAVPWRSMTGRAKPKQRWMGADAR
jgi:hypothetical protein